MTVSVKGLEENRIKAIKEAAKGRLGERFNFTEQPGDQLIISFNADPEYLNAPDQMRYDLTEPKNIPGTGGKSQQNSDKGLAV